MLRGRAGDNTFSFLLPIMPRGIPRYSMVYVAGLGTTDLPTQANSKPKKPGRPPKRNMSRSSRLKTLSDLQPSSADEAEVPDTENAESRAEEPEAQTQDEDTNITANNDDISPQTPRRRTIKPTINVSGDELDESAYNIADDRNVDSMASQARGKRKANSTNGSSDDDIDRLSKIVLSRILSSSKAADQSLPLTYRLSQTPEFRPREDSFREWVTTFEDWIRPETLSYNTAIDALRTRLRTNSGLGTTITEICSGHHSWTAVRQALLRYFEDNYDRSGDLPIRGIKQTEDEHIADFITRLRRALRLSGMDDGNPRLVKHYLETTIKSPLKVRFHQVDHYTEIEDVIRALSSEENRLRQQPKSTWQITTAIPTPAVTPDQPIEPPQVQAVTDHRTPAQCLLCGREGHNTTKCWFLQPVREMIRDRKIPISRNYARDQKNSDRNRRPYPNRAS